MSGALEERYEIASQWQLMWRKFAKHRLALLGGVMLTCLYGAAFFADFVAPYGTNERYSAYAYSPPQIVRFWDESGFSLRPFVHPLNRERDPRTFRWIYIEDRSQRNYLSFFVRSDPYRFLGMFSVNRKLFSVSSGTLFLFGTDSLGRDVFSRTIHAARISLTVGLVGVTLSFIVGVFLGGVSGYYGGNIDTVIQRIIEYLISIPTVPLWMALSAALPPEWSSIQVFFGVTILLSVVGWCGVARVVRGKFLELREQDFVLAARLAGAKDRVIIATHLVPSFLSYLIVHLTLAIPGMILGETALSYLGLGIRAPAVSWGTLLNAAQSVRVVSLYPWLLIPSAFVIITVLSFNLLGDGLRDAADPYK